MATRFYLLLAVVIAWTPTGVEADELCPPDFMSMAGLCIYTVTSPVLNTWRESYDACQSKYKANIVMINSDFFWQAILQGGASQLNIAPGGIWMGLNYTFATNKYMWMDGSELTPESDWTLWGPGQPIKADKDKCVLLEKTYVIKKRFGWSLVDCDDQDTTGVAICLLQPGTWSLDDGGGEAKPTVATGGTGGQTPIRASWVLITSAFMLLLGIGRAIW